MQIKNKNFKFQKSNRHLLNRTMGYTQVLDYNHLSLKYVPNSIKMHNKVL